MANSSNTMRIRLETAKVSFKTGTAAGCASEKTHQTGNWSCCQKERGSRNDSFSRGIDLIFLDRARIFFQYSRMSPRDSENMKQSEQGLCYFHDNSKALGFYIFIITAVRKREAWRKKRVAACRRESSSTASEMAQNLSTMVRT